MYKLYVNKQDHYDILYNGITGNSIYGKDENDKNKSYKVENGFLYNILYVDYSRFTGGLEVVYSLNKYGKTQQYTCTITYPIVSKKTNSIDAMLEVLMNHRVISMKDPIFKLKLKYNKEYVT